MKHEYTEIFEKFWDAFPGSKTPGFGLFGRKTDKPKCFELWQARGYEKIAGRIIANVEVRAQFDFDWRKDDGKYLQAPLVYLRNERWESEWVDTRNKTKRAQEPYKPSEPEYHGPHYSRWATYANKLLVRKFMKYKGDRGKLSQILAAKTKLVEQAEDDDQKGERWADEDFKDVLDRTLERAFNE